MLNLNKDDLFPLGVGAGAAAGGWTYAEAQAHSAMVDDELGFKIDDVERELLAAAPVSFASAREEQHWIGLPAKTLQTPYTEIRFLLSLLGLKPGDRVVDLGAGYGRMGFVIAKHHPGVSFIGFEVVAARVHEGSRVLSKFVSSIGADSIDPHSTVTLREADLSSADFVPPVAEFYFLYDFGSRAAIAKSLADLRAISLTKKICVIGRGRASRDAIERGEPWLSQVNDPQHYDHFSIYRS